MDEYVEINDDKNCLLKLCEKLEEKLCVVKEQQEKKSQKIKWLEEEKIRLEGTVSSQKEQSQKVKRLEEEKARLEETVSSLQQKLDEKNACLMRLERNKGVMTSECENCEILEMHLKKSQEELHEALEKNKNMLMEIATGNKSVHAKLDGREVIS